MGSGRTSGSVQYLDLQPVRTRRFPQASLVLTIVPRQILGENRGKNTFSFKASQEGLVLALAQIVQRFDEDT